MLSRTTRLTKREGALHIEQQQQPPSYLESLRDQLENIMEALLAQKKIAEERWSAEKQALNEELQNRDAKIEKLQVRVRQLQRENDQIRYQYSQRVSLMAILKQQNSLLSRQYAQDKERMKETIDLLLAHNHALKQALTVPPPPSPRLPQQKTVLFAKPQPFYSMTDLRKAHSNGRLLTSKHPPHKYKHQFPTESEDEPSFVRDLEPSVGEFSEAEGKGGREWEFHESRITEVKGRGELLGLDRMSAVTQQSRQRGRH